MKKYSVTFLLTIFFFYFNSPAQIATQTLQEIEEHGTPTIKIDDYNTFLDTTTWVSGISATSTFGRAIAGVIGNYIYVFTGQGTTTLAMAYNISTQTWVASTTPTGAGYNAAFCVAQGCLYKMSGTGSVSVFEKFTPAGDGTGTWTVLTAAPSALMAAQNSIVWDGGNYIYASSGDYASPPVSSFAKYNISTGIWTSLTGSPFVKRYAGMAALNGKIYLIGGLIPDGADPTICQAYDTTTQSWSTIAPFPIGINFTKWTVTTDGRYIFVIGSGGGYSTYPSSEAVYYYDPATNQWIYDSTFPVQRGLGIGLYVPSLNKLFQGGGNTGNSSTNYQNTIFWGSGGVYIPVELTNFNAVSSNNNVTLKWTTSSEKNNKGFFVERRNMSDLSVVWKNAGFVSGHGTTTEKMDYSFLDMNVPQGKYVYRLSQVDYNGTKNILNQVEVDISGQISFTLEQNYPNPFNPGTIIKYQIPELSHVSLKVFDVIGNEVATLVNETKQTGNYKVKFDALNTGLSDGIYFYQLKAGMYIETKKMILLK